VGPPVAGWLQRSIVAWCATAPQEPPPAVIEPPRQAVPAAPPAPPVPSIPPVDEERTQLLSALATAGATVSERRDVVQKLLARQLEAAHLEAIVNAFADRGRRELIDVLERTLRATDAAPLACTNAARLAGLVADASLAPALLDRLEAVLAADPARAKELVRALRSAIDAARRRVTELESGRLAQAPADACVAAMGDGAPEVRRAALARLVELARRRGEAPDPSLERARELSLSRLAAAAAANPAAAPLAAEELRLHAALVAELSPNDRVVVRLWIDWFDRASERETRLSLLAALRRMVRDEPDPEVAAVAVRLLQAGTDGEAEPGALAALEALRFVGDETTLPVIVLLLAAEGGTRVRLRQAAVAAVAGLARRSRDPDFTRRGLDLLARTLQSDASEEVRQGAALGLSLVVDSVGALRRDGPAEAALDAENLGRAFDALRVALRTAGRDRALAEQCAKALCRVPGREEAAAQVLADVLMTSEPTPAVREVLLRALKEIGSPAALTAIVAALPKGGPAFEPDAPGKEAYAALLAVIRRAQAGGTGVPVQLDVVTACLAAGEAEWALQFAGQLFQRIDDPECEALRVAIRVAYGRAAARGRAPETLERGWLALDAAVDDPQATAAQQLEARLAMLDLAERSRPLHAADAAAEGARALASPALAAAARADVVKRCASLWLIAGSWESAYDLLDREIDERDAPPELLVLKARAASRRDAEGAVRDALRIHELLVGPRGAGGRLPAEAGDRLALVLALVRIYVDSDRIDDARETLAALPPADAVPAELREMLDQLKRQVSD